MRQRPPAALNNEVMSAMASMNKEPEVSAAKPPELTPDVISFRESDVVVKTLRLALGYALPGKTGPLFAAQVGVYRGRSLALLASALNDAKVDVTIAAFDSFAGLPELSDNDVKLAGALLLQRRRLLFSDTTRREVEAFLKPFNGGARFELHEGWLANTLPAAPERKYFFVNLSCKLHSSHMTALAYFYERLSPGGVMLFDDYLDKSYAMAKVAIDAFMADKPETIYHLQCGDGMSSFRRAFVMKR